MTNANVIRGIIALGKHLKRTTICAGALTAAFGLVTPWAHAAIATGHDNSTNPAHDFAWTHGDPNTGLAPGSTSDGYYYLKANAVGNNVWCEIYTGGNWLLQLENGNKDVLAQATFKGTGGAVFITNGVAGNEYQCRIANTSPAGGQVQKDYAELNSGVTNNTTTSDCGGPGKVWDPNFNERPMEPKEPSGMPVNGCSHQVTVPYKAGDPRLSPPGQHTFNLGTITGNFNRTITTTKAGDLTAIAFFGHQGTNGTLEITNAAGTVVNGWKWGDKAPNPKTMNQEFVGVDAGVQPPGTYHVIYTGPSNTTQDAYALEVDLPQP
jgi:hypothetical protein